ncbi:MULTISPECIES: heavy-metal-associated domain-containing protein [unclassified Variovorax]|uniref:heavy-metal-associated domain-containing protein n=1 Tax=unclassified Variovorax TaxID=663243 RepID=UPI003F44ADB8
MQAALAPFSTHPSAAAATADTWQVLDDPAEWPAFGQLVEGDAATGQWASQVAVEGMHCTACAFTVEAALLKVPGVREAQVNGASRRARVV